jgi:hypothetical protein
MLPLHASIHQFNLLFFQAGFAMSLSVQQNFIFALVWARSLENLLLKLV